MLRVPPAEAAGVLWARFLPTFSRSSENERESSAKAFPLAFPVFCRYRHNGCLFSSQIGHPRRTDLATQPLG